MECRGVVGRHDAFEDCITLWTSTQMPNLIHGFIVHLLGVDENRVRIITPDVGGGFGPKFLFYSEELVVALSSKLCGRPIKWIEDRREHFVSTVQERDQYWEAEIALDDEGMILGVRGHLIHDHGAYTVQGITLPYNAAACLPGPYKVPSYRMDQTLVFTNMVSCSPVRGASHPQGTFVMERLMDRAARELNMDRAFLREKNMILGAEMPYRKPLKTRAGVNITYDSGDFPKAMQMAKNACDYVGFQTRQAAARAEGRYLGIGISFGVKGTGRGPFEMATVRIGTSGKISVYTGAAPMGQGTHTMLAQVVAEQLGGNMDNIEVVAGDTAPIPMGMGGFGSRQTITAGSSAHLAAVEVREKALKVAAHILEASEEDLEIEGTEVRVKGVPDMSVSLAKVAHAVAGTPGTPFTHTMLAQVVAEQLGGNMDNIEVVAGDTAPIPMGMGGFGSRQTITAGSSAHLAAVEVREKALKVAAHILEASEEDLEIEGTEVRVKGVPDMSVSLAKVAHAVAGTPGYALPSGISPGMESTQNFLTDPLAYCYGCHICEVDVDPETGGVDILNYTIVHDSGVLINPMIVTGQVQGGVAHGIGNALFEWMGYDDDAQPVTTNFGEYLLPSAPEVPNFDIEFLESPSPLNPLGVKGAGEGSTVPTAAAVISAIENALSPFGVHISEAPVMPARLVEMVAQGKSAAP